jgi:peptidoglycan/LPS O-acetylase OafA/YrhL
MASAPRTTLETLQAGRALAAIAVVCFHANLNVGQDLEPLPAWLSRGMSLGYLGIDFFFVLSGFIIYYTNVDRAGQPGWGRGYVVNRLSRIYLPYWPVGVGLAGAYLLFPEVSQGNRQWGWFPTITLLPGTARPAALSVAWTLQHELLFYALAFVLLRWRIVLIGSVVWSALILAILALGYRSTPGFALLDLEFLFGMAAAWYCLSRGAGREALAALVGIALVLAWFLSADRTYSVFFGLGLALMLPAIVRAEWSGKVRVHRVWRLLGDASYAIYLIHLPLMSLVARLSRGLDPILAAALAVLASIAAGIAFHRLFELPALALVRKRLLPRPTGFHRTDSIEPDRGKEQAEKHP